MPELPLDGSSPARVLPARWAAACALAREEQLDRRPRRLLEPGHAIEKRTAWEKTWVDHRREDAGKALTPEVPPTCVQADFLEARCYAQRGKLDVPKERFIAFTEVPRAEGEEPLFGWAGGRPTQRVRAILDLDEQLDDAGISA